MRLWGFFGALCAVALCALMAVVLWPAPAPLIAWGPLPLTLDEAAIERGRYMAIAGDCVACHTAPAGRPFAGGLAIASPFGPIYSSNITPDRQTGIGSYTLDEFERALRRGIARDGSSLYPAMPYPSFARLSIADVKDLYGYLMHGVEPVAQQNQAVGIRLAAVNALAACVVAQGLCAR
jgi:alcohol dehydrogenase (quinone), cytochrome c subunit